jgi:tRNA pseudouridine55 synthase
MANRFGLLNINKPAGVTSRDVVNHVQRLIRPTKIGHAGTLDPLATGVLVLCLGPATRLIQYVQQLPKRYIATFLLGRQSDTEDIDGTIAELPDARIPTTDEINAALPQFVGAIQQQPPAYSAIKVKGQRAYKLAREGRQVELDSRPVTIHGIELASYEYPELVLDVRCGSGTYIRSLGRDLARQLGTAAVMSALVRTEIGPFLVGRATELQQINAGSLEELLLPPTMAVEQLPSITVTADQLKMLANGVPIRAGRSVVAEEIAALDSAGRLVAILSPHREDQLRPSVNFAAALHSAAAK